MQPGFIQTQEDQELQVEHMLGKGNSNYAEFITGMMVTMLFLWFNILAAYIHMKNMMVEKEEIQLLFSSEDDSFSSLNLV